MRRTRLCGTYKPGRIFPACAASAARSGGLTLREGRAGVPKPPGIFGASMGYASTAGRLLVTAIRKVALGYITPWKPLEEILQGKLALNFEYDAP